MSRIGNKPVEFTPDVKIAVVDGVVNVEGKLGKLSFAIPQDIAVELEDKLVHVKCLKESANALHGLTRSLIHNMVVGVSKGYSKNSRSSASVTRPRSPETS